MLDEEKRGRENSPGHGKGPTGIGVNGRPRGGSHHRKKKRTGKIGKSIPENLPIWTPPAGCKN